MNATSDIFEAIDAGDLDRLRALVRDDPTSALVRDETGVSVLLYAHYRGLDDTVAVLREQVDELDVFEAAALGDTDRLRSLVEGRPSLADAWSPDGFTPLHLAAFFGHDAAAAYLIDRGASVNVVSQNAMRVMPLHSAIAGRHAGIARALVTADADVNSKQQDAFTPLHEAAQNGDLELVEFLLAHKAEPTARLTDGRTPAELARDHGHEVVAQRLGDS
jgi:uncharacterized protein